MVDINVGAITEAINNKADRDAGNLTAEGIANIIRYGMPDYSAGVSKTVNTLYTAEVDGFIFAFRFSNLESNIEINGTIYTYHAGNAGNIYVGASIFIPISKGDTYKVTAANTFIFYPCKGV